MIIVGFGKALHDCSVCVSINGKIKYAKYEREVNVKSIPAPTYWFWKKLIEWNIDFKKIDLLVHLDANDYGNKYKIKALPKTGEDFLIPKSTTREKEILLDHHLAHLWSNTNFNGKKDGIIIDGRGSDDNTVLIKNKEDKKRFNYISPGGVFIELVDIMGIHLQEHGNSSGKLMGMMNYGKLDKNFYLELIKFLPEKVKEVLFPILKINFNNKFDQRWFVFI
jgi:predicted NodU family carbamoyl transferase